VDRIIFAPVFYRRGVYIYTTGDRKGEGRGGRQAVFVICPSVSVSEAVEMPPSY